MIQMSRGYTNQKSKPVADKNIVAGQALHGLFGKTTTPYNAPRHPAQ
jgi:hypothetical protein